MRLRQRTDNGRLKPHKTSQKKISDLLGAGRLKLFSKAVIFIAHHQAAAIDLGTDGEKLISKPDPTFVRKLQP